MRQSCYSRKLQWFTCPNCRVSVENPPLIFTPFTCSVKGKEKPGRSIVYTSSKWCFCTDTEWLCSVKCKVSSAKEINLTLKTAFPLLVPAEEILKVGRWCVSVTMSNIYTCVFDVLKRFKWNYTILFYFQSQEPWMNVLFYLFQMYLSYLSALGFQGDSWYI